MFKLYFLQYGGIFVKKSRNVIKTASLLMIVTFFSKMTGFIRELFLGINFGATYEADAYIIAMTVPNIIFTSLIVAAMTCFIPIYNEVLIKEGEEEALRFSNNILNIVILISVVFIIVVLSFTYPIVKLVAGGFEGEVLKLAVELLRMSAIMMLFMGISQIYMAYLQSNESFIITAANNILANILVIIAFLFSEKIGIIGVIIISVIGTFSQILIQYPYMKKNGYEYRLILNFKDKYLKKMIILFVPILVSTCILELNMLIDKSLASRLAEGSISALNYANKLNLFVFGIVSVSVSAIVFPKLSRCNSNGDIKNFIKISNESINIITLLTVPILIFVLFFSEEIVTSLFAYGKFDENAVKMTATALTCYAFGMLFMGYRDLLNKIFYSIHNTKVPMLNSIFATVLNIILNLLLVKSLKHNGLALASSISLFFATILMIISLNKIKNIIKLREMLNVIIKSLIAAITMGLIIKWIYSTIINIVDSNFIVNLILLSIVFIIGVVIYIVIAYILKLKEISRSIKSVMKSIKR